ncbi:MAG: HAD family phosphatase [Clostridiales bacterium]|nr:HAD family phosphatase [Clostridiales bacterium]
MKLGAIFDADGTLLDSTNLWDTAAERYVLCCGKTPEEGLGKKLFPMTMIEGGEYIRQRYGLEGSAEDICRGVVELISHGYKNEVLEKPGIKDFLRGLSEMGIPMTIATAGDRGILSAALSRLGIAGYFEKIFTCSELGTGKHEPRIYLEAAEFMGTLPSNTLVFEDAVHAARTAAGAGFRVVGVRDVDPAAEEELRKTAWTYLENFSDFEGFAKKVRGLE